MTIPEFIAAFKGKPVDESMAPALAELIKPYKQILAVGRGERVICEADCAHSEKDRMHMSDEEPDECTVCGKKFYI